MWNTGYLLSLVVGHARPEDQPEVDAHSANFCKILPEGPRTFRPFPLFRIIFDVPGIRARGGGRQYQVHEIGWELHQDPASPLLRVVNFFHHRLFLCLLIFLNQIEQCGKVAALP